ncbi:TIR domain-containing protein [Pseudofrankia sp. BMG5.37]|uniref:toll/interleukin-1 receptor domain-containing protein n=1 Tax=Pseudofrankia sp. BMG5.37 TaxID=3050035 RepID=UPI00289614F1|nr:TIR domain-containing protein [Pseudofrankia sp. BMG5.37]MDT3443935.1 TIR domain-containing protein [Pseudofrankia sp. BMG5.37]
MTRLSDANPAGSESEDEPAPLLLVDAGDKGPKGDIGATRPAQRYLYDAFLSYNQAADRQLAPSVRTTLHRLARPWYRLRALWVFLDSRDMAAEPDLPRSVTAALDRSRFLVVFVNEQAAASKWVEREVSYWLKSRSFESVIICRTGGTLAWDAAANRFVGNALPPSLQVAYDNEPRWVDLSWAAHRAQSSHDTRFRDAVAEIAAPLHGVTKEQLVGEDVRQRRRTRWLVGATILVLLLLTVTSAGLADLALAQRDEARRQTAAAISQRVAVQAAALRQTDPSLAAQLSLAAYQVSPTQEARDSLLSSLSGSLDQRLTGPATSVTSVAFSPDGRLLAAGYGADDTVWLWDVRDRGRVTPRLSVIRAGLTGVYALAFSPDSHTLAVGGIGAAVWDLTDPRHPTREAALPTRSNPIAAIAFRPTGGLLAALDKAGEVHLWQVTDSRRPVAGAVFSYGGRPSSLVFSPDGRGVALGEDGTVVLCDLADTGRLTVSTRLPTGEGSRSGPAPLAFAPNGRLLAAAGDDGDGPTVWDLSEGRTPRPQLLPVVQSADLTGLAFSPDSQTLAGSSADHTMVLWDITRRMPVKSKPHPGFVSSVAFSPDGTTVATGAVDGVVRLWPVHGRVLDNQGGNTTALAVGPGGRLLALAGVDRTVRLVDGTDPPRPRGLITGLPAPADCLSVSADSRVLVACAGARAWLWDISDPDRPVPRGPLPATDVSSAQFGSAANALLATGNPYGTVTLWDVADLERPRTMTQLSFPSYAEATWSLAFDPAGRTLASAGPAVVALWNLDQPRGMPQLVAAADDATAAVAFSPNGRTLAVAVLGHAVNLFDVTAAPPRLVATLRGHTDSVIAMTFSPDGRTLASGGKDGSVRLWDVADPSRARHAATLTSSSGMINGLGFVGGSRMLGVAAATTWLMDTDLAHGVSGLCSRVGDPLSRDEWQRYFAGRPYRPPCR